MIHSFYLDRGPVAQHGRAGDRDLMLLTTRSWVRNSKATKFPPGPSNFNISPEKARIHAHLCGDGDLFIYIRKRSPSSRRTSWSKDTNFKVYTIEYNNMSLALRKQFINDVKKTYGNVYIYERSRGKITIRRKEIYEEMVKLCAKNSRKWRIPKEILNASNEIKSTWLEAFYDDEATVDVNHKRIDLKSVNLKGLKQVKLLVSDVGIRSYINGPYERMWMLRISSNEIKKFYETINFVHPSKKKKLKILVTAQ